MHPTTVVLATGRSLSSTQLQRVHQARLAGKAAVIAVNDAFRLAPWADMLYATDAQWWRVNEQEALAFEGRKLSCDKLVPYKQVRILRQTGTEGFDPLPGNVRTGGNSGYVAVHLAVACGAKRVILLGFDMHGDHFFGRHRAPLRTTDADTFKRWIPRFAALNGHGAEILNCTPGSALTCFPQVDLETALC